MGNSNYGNSGATGHQLEESGLLNIKENFSKLLYLRRRDFNNYGNLEMI